MRNAIDELESKIPLLTQEEKRELQAHVRRLIDVIMRNVHGDAQHLEGHSSRYRECWSLVVERRRSMLKDFERIVAMLD